MVLSFSFILFSGQILKAQKIDNINLGEVFVNGDALYYNEGEVAGNIIFQSKSSNKEKIQNAKTGSLNTKNKEKSKLALADEKTKKKVVKNPSKVHYTLFPSKSSDSFSLKSSTVSCAVNQIEHYIKKTKEKSIYNSISSSSFLFQIKHTSITRDYVNNYKLSYYLQSYSIRPPPAT